MMHENQRSGSALRRRQLWLTVGWLLVTLVAYLSLSPTRIQLPVAHGDKFEHILAYAVLMSWFASLYAASAQRMLFAIVFVLFGISLEFTQGWTGYGTFDVADMVADAIGVAAGWLLSPPRIPHYLHLIEKILRFR